MDIPGLSFKKQVDGFVDGVKDQLGGIVLLIGAIWIVFLSDFIPYVEWYRWLALRPRHATGLIGVVTMPFVHGSWAHIISNTIPLIITLLTLAALRPKTWTWVVSLLIITSGLLTWLVGGYNQAIVGASGLVMGLVTFLVAPGLFLLAWWGWHRFHGQAKLYPYKIRLLPLIVSGVVGFFYLDKLFFGLVPVGTPLSGISWRAHWCGAIAGCLVAFLFIRSGQGDSLPDEMQQTINELSAKTKPPKTEDIDGGPGEPVNRPLG